MNFEKYTNSSKKIINDAQNSALGKKHQKITPMHIFSELLNSNHDLIIRAFEGSDLNQIKIAAQSNLAKEPSNGGNGQIFADPKLIHLFEKAEKLASEQQDNYVSIDSLLISTIQSDSNVEAIIKKEGLNLNKIQNKISEIRKSSTSDSESSDDNFNALEKYTINVTQKAQNRDFGLFV